MKRYDIWDANHNVVMDVELSDEQAQRYETYCEKNPDGFVKRNMFRALFGRDIGMSLENKALSKVFACEIVPLETISTR